MARGRKAAVMQVAPNMYVPVICDRCRRQMFQDTTDADEWNTVFDKGHIAGFLCPDCQTEEESIEAQVNEATGAMRGAHVLTEDDAARDRGTLTRFCLQALGWELTEAEECAAVTRNMGAGEYREWIVANRDDICKEASESGDMELELKLFYIFDGWLELAEELEKTGQAHLKKFIDRFGEGC